MDKNNNAPREGAEQKKNDGRKPYHKYNHHRRKPNASDNSGQDFSPNGAINVKPGRYDLPPEAKHEEASVTPEPETTPAANAEQPKSQKPRRPKRQQNRNESKPANTSAETAKETAAEAPKADEPSSEAAATEPRQKRSSRNNRRRNNHRRERGNQKNVSAEELDQLTEEAAAIDEYIAVANANDAAPTEGEIIDELNSAESPEEVPGTEPTAEPEPSEPPVTYEIVGVRFKSAGKIYYFDPDGLKCAKNEAVIVDTARGLEYGVVDLGNRIVTEREVVLPLRKVIRHATADDIARAEANVARAAEALEVCNQKIAEHKIEMKLVDVEYTFDNSKLLFYFTADGRVDFRELVKDLASVFRTRIELRQIGIRDETKLLGGIGICGRPFCCKTFLSDFVQVSIKMAKEQNLSLNSVKISGACGRLMCCLRYEYDTYQEEIRKTPKVDQIVSTPDGDGTVIEVQPLAGLVRVRFIDKPDTIPKVYHRDSVTVIGGKNAPRQKNTESNNG